MSTLVTHSGHLINFCPGDVVYVVCDIDPTPNIVIQVVLHVGGHVSYVIRGSSGCRECYGIELSSDRNSNSVNKPNEE